MYDSVLGDCLKMFKLLGLRPYGSNAQVDGVLLPMYWVLNLTFPPSFWGQFLGCGGEGTVTETMNII